MSQLGAIADDFTGATDLATNLVGRGFQVIVVAEDGIGANTREYEAYEAVVVALKTRTAQVATAVADSLRALEFLQSLGCQRFYDKYCSTFDSTDEGNIGPVLDALSERLGAERTVVVPSFPANGRVVREGVLYVGGELLEDSSMRHHPLTPMTRSRVSDILSPQTPFVVSELHSAIVDDDLVAALHAETARYVIIDAATDEQLAAIARAIADDVLVSGGSGLALGLEPKSASDAPSMTVTTGRRLVLSGSASSATREQVLHAVGSLPTLKIDVERLITEPQALLAESLKWLAAQPADEAVLVYAVDSLDDLALSRSLAAHVDPAERVEWMLSQIAVEATSAALGFSRIIVAGGETSGAVVKALALPSLVIGPRIAPGVCWASGMTPDGVAVNLALKSGNFGAQDMFTTAWKVLGE